MNKIKIFFAGDFCSKPSTSGISIQEELKALICESDISVVNFEVPLKPQDIELPKVSYERFFQNDDVPSFLKSIGFNIFSMANNHLFDWGIEGYKKTTNALKDAYIGAGTYDDAYSVKVLNVSGKRIGFLALCYAARGGVFDDVYNHEGVGCAYINDLKVNHTIIEAKKKLDYLFILPHAGIEYVDAPTPELMARYRDFIDYGADGVIASHPHCPQGWEVYKEKPIFYSLGNFFFNSKNTYDFVAQCPHWYEGVCAILELGDKISFKIINTRNIKNREIVIDYSIDRDKHNEYLCELISNQQKYNLYIDKLVLAKETLLSNIFPVFTSVFSILRFCIICLIKRESIKTVLYDKIKDDDERNIYLKLMGKLLKG